MDSSSCSFSLLNMIQYTLYSVLFQTNRRNTIHRPLRLRLLSYRASFHYFDSSSSSSSSSSE